MEIVIFRKNEISEKLFENQVVYITDTLNVKQECYGNYIELDATKARLDYLDKKDEKIRRAAAKYLHEHELVKIICKKQVISRAYFKLYEMIYFEPLIRNQSLDCFFICEAPGGFIECVSDIRRKKNLQTKFISISKLDNYIKYGNYLDHDSLLYGDVTDITTIDQTIRLTQQRFPNGFDLITADGGFDVKVFVAQEMLSSKLLLCEIYLAISTQKKNGIFIIKFFDMFSHNSVVYYLMLCSMYDYVKIIKPKSSRNCNSERYLICYNFKGGYLKNQIREIIENFQLNETHCTKVFPNLQLPNLEKLKSFNNILVYEQIKIIRESIKMVQSKSNYLQNLLLSIFMDRGPEINKVYTIVQYKNILASRIKKCMDFLRVYGIHTHQFIGFDFKIN